jgi:hypothetical protein
MASRLLCLALYWGIVFDLPHRVSPIHHDGGGPMPSFYWGCTFSPDYAEYYANRLYYDFHFQLAYILFASLLTFAASHRSGLRSILYVAATLFAVTLLSDILSWSRVLEAPLFLLHNGWDASFFVLTFIPFFVILSLLAPLAKPPNP